MRNFSKNKKGISLVETIVYIFILTLVSIIIVNALGSLTSSYRAMKKAEVIENTAQIALERMVREIRGASSIEVSQSTLNASPGVLVLNTTDDLGTPAVVRFYVLNERINLDENGVAQGPLSPVAVRITALTFRRITTLESEAVKIEMTVESSGTDIQIKNFNSTVVLRGSYLP
jgi:hypothetical protein